MANKTVEKTNPDTFLKEMNEVCCTKVTEEDLKDAIEDEYRVMYSRDGKKLLKVYFSLCGEEEYVVREETEVTCDGAFRYCKSLQSVTIPNSVTSIGYSAFSGCRFLQSVTIPNSVTSIGDYAFSSCVSLQSITIPNSVTKIGDGAFCGCESLQSVTIPNSVTNIGNNAFSGCNICFFICNSPYFQNDDVCLFNKDKTAIVCRIKDCVNYIIPNSVTSIGDWAFSGCDSLQSVTIPNSVTSIGDHAFRWCKSLQSVTIPDSVTKIGNYAFCGCRLLDEPSRLRLMESNDTQI